MKSFFACVLAALAAQVSATPLPASECGDWMLFALEKNSEQLTTFAPNDNVTLTWSTQNSKVEYIREVGLFSAKSNEFLHAQYMSFPGANATDGQLSFDLSVPLCLQRDDVYYLGVYASTPGEDSNCFSQTPLFKLSADLEGNYTVCNL
ncbi:hypothetical protein K7432_003353 [Basidiobolus ranarum]|uniref:Uncharacterized protein n=1 Tax=Basidiobolus ranarum TaxID=34480 RepID=A0ABR2W6Q1_9FUNG